MAKDYVTLQDEHDQVIEITKGQRGKFFWTWRDLDDDLFGPFNSRQAAIDDANSFCNESAC